MEENAGDFLGSLSTLYEGNQFAIIALNGTRVPEPTATVWINNVDIERRTGMRSLSGTGICGSGRKACVFPLRNHPEWKHDDPLYRP